MARLKTTTVISGNDIFTEFKGALTEQYVMQQLLLSYEPYYFSKPKSTQEIDFLIEDEEGEVIPIEVKAETNCGAVARGRESLSEKCRKTPLLACCPIRVFVNFA